MRKTYSKPEIVFEGFTLSTNIAGGCEIIVDTQSGGTCGYEYEGGNGQTLFTSAMVNICDIPVNDDPSNGFCYHVPVDTNNLFNS